MPKPHAGEDVAVIRLTRHKGLTVHRNRRKLAAAGKDGALIRVAVGLFGGAFRLGGRIGKRKDNWTFVDPGHRREYRRGEGARLARCPDDRRWFDGFDDREKISMKRIILGKAPLVLRLGRFGW